MENIKLLSFAILLISQLSLKVLGQANAKYYPDPTLDNFSGTWESIGNEKNFQLVLTKKKFYIKAFDAYVDQIEGYYIYDNSRSTGDAIKNGMNDLDAEGKTRNNALSFLIKDNALDKIGRGFMLMDADSNNTATMGITKVEWAKNNEFSIPTALKLRKMK